MDKSLLLLRIDSADRLYDFWHGALVHCINRKMKTQKDISNDLADGPVKCSKGHLNAIYKRRKTSSGNEVKAGTELQEAIANVFGYSMVEFIKLGQSVLEDDIEPENHGQEEDLTKLGEVDLMEEIKSRIEGYKEECAVTIKSVASTMDQLVRDRNRLHAEVKKLRAMVNSIDEDIKVVNRDKIIVYSNSANVRHNGENVGDTCEQNITECKTLVEKVFATGAVHRDLVLHDGIMFTNVAYPVFSEGQVKEVVCVTRTVNQFVDVMLERYGKEWASKLDASAKRPTERGYLDSRSITTEEDRQSL